MNSPRAFWIITAIAGALLRLSCLPLAPELGYLPDHDDFARWGIQATDRGVLSLYDEPPPPWDLRAKINGQWSRTRRGMNRLCNYPPLSAYALWGSGMLFKAVDSERLINTASSRAVFALPTIAADLLLAFGCAAVVALRRPGGPARLAFGAVLFLPPLIWDSVIWGQVDSWALAPAVWMLWAMLSDRWLAAGLLFGVMAGLKTQAVLLLPLWAFAPLLVRPIWKPAAGFAVAVAALLAFATPFMLHSRDLRWFEKSYVENFTAYEGQTTLKAFNLWYLDALVTDSIDESRPLLGMSRGRVGRLLLVAALAAGYLAMARRWRNNRTGLLAWTPYLLTAAVLLPTQVHERYLLLTLPFLVVAAAHAARVWPAVAMLAVVALAQVTWPVWLTVGPGAFDQMIRMRVQAMQQEGRSPPPDFAERIEPARREYRRDRGRTEPVEWALTLLALAGGATAAVALLRFRPSEGESGGDAARSRMPGAKPPARPGVARLIGVAGLAATALGITGCKPVANPPATSGSASSASTATKSVSARHPHVILISLCSVRADHLGCYGYPRATSPRIDALARDAVLFEAAETPWPKTTPSFCSVMTGLYPHQTGVMRTTAPEQHITADVDTLAERCRRAGYRTAAFTTTPGVSIATGLQQGFEVYEETWRDPPGRPTNEHRLATVSLGLDWLAKRRAEPCLLWVHFNNAHYPYGPAPAFRDLFLDDAHYDASVTLPLRQKDEELDIPLPPDHPAPMPVRRPDLGGLHDLIWPIETKRAADRIQQRDLYVARYDAAIRSADEQVGLLLDGLRGTVGDDPFIVALWSDHGESLGEHNYYFEHGRFAYETCSHVPFLLRDSERWPTGGRVAEPVSTVDLAATICERIGAPADGLAGTPLAEVVAGTRPRGDVFTCGGYHWDFITAIRHGRWRLHRIPNPLDQRMMQKAPLELYDLAADPLESHNLAAASAATAAELDAALTHWSRDWWSAATTPCATASAPSQTDPTLRGNLKKLGYLED